MKKRCFKCGQEKLREEFYRHAQMGDGLLGKCKECTKKDVRYNYNKDLNLSRQRNRDRWYANVEENRRRERMYRTKNKEQRMVKKVEYTREYRKIHPEMYRAHKLVQSAVASGKLLAGPCAVCRTRGRIEAHHSDYSQPLNVVWLCSVHHKQAHIREGINV